MRHQFIFAALLAIILFPAHAADNGEAGDAFRGMRADLVDLVDRQIRSTSRDTGVSEIDPRVLAAMREVPRHEFVPKELRAFAYFDIPLPVGHEQNISQPFLIALMTHLVRVGPEDVVFETGTGAGYQAAILSRLAKEVYSVEVIKPLADAAATRLREMGYRNVEVHNGDGYFGWREKGPFDVMIIKEAVTELPAALVRQLRPGGRLIAPVGSPDRMQTLLLLEKNAAGELSRRPIIEVRFSPLQGGERI